MIIVQHTLRACQEKLKEAVYPGAVYHECIDRLLQVGARSRKELQKAGRIRAIGISNFRPRHIKKVSRETGIQFPVIILHLQDPFVMQLPCGKPLLPKPVQELSAES
jgi:aryl-alcohol dehydrogenase-like predicted oxidoreductase